MSLSVLRIVGPSIIGQVFCILMETINTVFIGHLGDTAKMAGVGLGNMYVNIFSQSIFLGLNGAVATLVSQSYGSGNLRSCGVFLNKGWFITLVAFIPVFFILMQCERFLLAVG